MRRDSDLLAACERDVVASETNEGGGPRGAPPPVLRIYRWEPVTVSLGQGQDPEAALDLAELDRRGLGWVKRPTGGRAVLHADELTYAVVAPRRGPFGESLTATHNRIAEALRRFYRALGVETALSRPAGAADLSPRLKAPCFVSPGQAELEVGGRKIAGSAQRRTANALLQHGSLPLGPEHLDLADLLPFPPGADAARARMRRTLAERSTCLRDLVSPLPDIPELERLLARAFAEEFACRWEGDDA